MITPCIAVCKIDRTTDLCTGCGRTKDEITRWSRMTDEERMGVMKRLGYANQRIGREKKLQRGKDVSGK